MKTTYTKHASQVHDLLHQAKTVAWLVELQYGGDSVDDAPGTQAMIETTLETLGDAASMFAAPEGLASEGAAKEVRRAHGLAAHLAALAKQDPAAARGFIFGDQQVASCYWTLGKQIDRAIEKLQSYSATFGDVREVS